MLNSAEVEILFELLDCYSNLLLAGQWSMRQEIKSNLPVVTHFVHETVQQSLRTIFVDSELPILGKVVTFSDILRVLSLSDSNLHLT